MKKALLFIATTLIAAGFLALVVSQAQSKEGALSATFLHGVLHVSIPYDAPRSGDGDLMVEVLDPEDRAVARFDRNIHATAARGFQEQDLPVSLPVEDLVWHRLRYRFIYQGDRAASLNGITSISRILRRPLVHVLDQQSYITGGPAAVRLVVTEAGNETPVTSGAVRIDLLTNEKERPLYTRAQFRFPAGLAGNYRVRYTVDTPFGSATQTQQIRLEEKSSILLTTEKPVYQPGQTIHVRALALDRASHQAVADHKLTFEAEDSRGNKLFRTITQTDAFGVASTEFPLAEEVNLGTWHLRALTDEGPAEIAFQVERYVLPKFKVAVELAGKDAHTKRGYRPGDHVTGTVRGNYFFGKAVDHAQVVVGKNDFEESDKKKGQYLYRVPIRNLACSDITIAEVFLEPGDGTPPHAHPGSEMLIPREGSGTVFYAEDGNEREVCRFSKTDEIYPHYSSETPHIVRNTGSTNATCLVIRFHREGPTGLDPKDAISN